MNFFKVFSASTLTLLLSLSQLATANPATQGFGFAGPGSQNANTVKAAQSAYDDSWVTLTGHIVRQLSKDEYLFKDHTGDIIIEVDEEQWAYLNGIVTPQTTLRIAGEVERNLMTSNEVEVEWIELISDTGNQHKGFINKGIASDVNK